MFFFKTRNEARTFKAKNPAYKLRPCGRIGKVTYLP